MIWPDYPALGWLALGALVALALGVSLWSWLRRWHDAVGLKFPVKGRAAPARRGWRARCVHLPLALRIGAVALVCVAALRPQLARDETAEVEGIDIVVALDLSGSMHTVDISDADLVRLQNRGLEPTDRFVAAVVSWDHRDCLKAIEVSPAAFRSRCTQSLERFMDRLETKITKTLPHPVPDTAVAAAS